MGAEWVSAIAAVVATIAGIVGLVVGRKSRPKPAARWGIANVGGRTVLVENTGDAAGYVVEARASGGSPRTNVLVKPGEAIEVSHGGFSPVFESKLQILWAAKAGARPESWERSLSPQSESRGPDDRLRRLKGHDA